MKHSIAQALLARLARNLYDDSPEKEALAAAAGALKFVHNTACHNGPVSIPAQTLFSKVKIEIEPDTVIEPPIKPYQKPEAPHAHADSVDEGSPAVDPGHDATRGVA